MIAVLIKCTIYEDCDHNVMFLSVLIKCTIYEDCDHDVMFLSLYMITIMIAVLIIKITTMIAVFTKMTYI